MTTKITEILNGFKEFSETPYEDSIKFLKEYLEVEPENQKAIFELGKALFFSENYDESIKYLTKTNDFKANAYLGLDYYKKEEHLNSIKHFEKFLKENENETILSYLMISYEKNHDLKNAIECGERLLIINPENSIVKTHLIDYHFNLEEYEKSLNYINELDEKKLRYNILRCDKLIYKKGLTLFKLKRYEEAIDALKNMKTIDAYLLISKSYLKLNKKTKAARYLFKSYELTSDIETLLEISDIYIEIGEYYKTEDILRSILEENPNNEKCLEKLINISLDFQKFQDTINYCETLLKVNDKNIAAYVALSEAYHYLGDLEKSLEIIETGLKVDSNSTELLTAKSWIDYIMNEIEYKKVLERLIKLQPNNTKHFVRLIEQFIWEDELDDARKYYEKLLFYNPLFDLSFEEIESEVNELKKFSQYIIT